MVFLVFGGFVTLGRWSRSTSGQDAENYWLAGRNNPWWLLLASIVATETSTVTFLSIPGLAYGTNLGWLQVAAGFVLGRYLVAHWLLPGYFRGELFTAYQLLREQFGLRAQQLTAILFVTTRTVADGLRLFLTGLVVEEFLGLPLEVAILLVAGITVAYTATGGLRAVLWADLIQLVIYLSGAALALSVLLQRLPQGWQTLMDLGQRANRFQVFDFGLSWTNPFNAWAGILGGCFLSLASHGVDQMMVQRYLAAGSIRQARRALVGSGWFVLFQFGLFLFLGVGLYSFYSTFPPEEAFERNDRVLVRFVVEELPTGGPGVLLGAILASAMSTLSSSLHSCATSWHQDLRRPTRAPPAAIDPSAATGAPPRHAQRLAVWGFAFAQVIIALLAQGLTQSLVSAVLGVASVTGGPMLGLFLLGRISKNLRERDALLALVSGVAAVLAVFFLTPLAWTWYAAVGCAATVTIGTAVARLAPQPPSSSRRATTSR